MQYFLFIEDKEATISCTVQGTDIAPDITFKKVNVANDCLMFFYKTVLNTQSYSNCVFYDMNLEVSSSF